ncbi:MAG: hypothetical protein HYV45_00370 [Candidatus Moranbacteria bacterium]|nr:hypothetical protein [Candidatus Moranbacteria bacterium]
MEEKKSTRTIKKKEGGGAFGIFFESIFKNIQSFVDGILESLHEAAHVFAKRLLWDFFLLVFACVGIVFLLVGMTRLLTIMYPLPGVSEMIVGGMILFIAGVVFMWGRRGRA